METPLAYREKARAAAAAGNHQAAAAIYREAASNHPAHADLLNSAGSFHAGRAEHAMALSYFTRARAASAGHPEAVLNCAITLDRLGRPAEALRLLDENSALVPPSTRYWSARASIERALGELDAAAASYDRALALDGGNTRALHGRARVALERAEAAMCQRYEALLAVQQNDAEAWLGYAQALDSAGRTAEAHKLTEQLIGMAPGWIAALEYLAQLRWAAGDRDSFCDHYEASVRQSADPAIWLSWSRTLSGVDRFEETAHVAGRATSAHPADSRLALWSAIHAGEAGDDARAEQIFADLRLDTAERLLHEARHRLRLNQPERADRLLASVLDQEPEMISAWALRDIAWRMLDDPRSHWLHRQDGLVQRLPLDIGEAALAALITKLNTLHDQSAMPVGQSVRGGSQTRGGLFDRMEPEIRAYRLAIEKMMEDYRRQLPPADATHPLLRHRDAPWAIRGSWSIRMDGGGRHTEHVHPQGLLSSASYLLLPDDHAQNAGHLELGRPPPDLRLDLPPISTIEPRTAHAVLFPSTLYHGTRPFAAGRRLSVAFDIVTRTS